MYFLPPAGGRHTEHLNQNSNNNLKYLGVTFLEFWRKVQTSFKKPNEVSSRMCNIQFLMNMVEEIYNSMENSLQNSAPSPSWDPRPRGPTESILINGTSEYGTVVLFRV